MIIAQILHHSAYAVGATFEQVFLDGWHVRLGRELGKRTSWSIQCLMHDPCIQHIFSLKLNSVKLLAFHTDLSLRAGIEYSRELIHYLQYISQKQDLLMHIHGDSNLMAGLLAAKFSHTPIVLQEHGYPPNFLTLKAARLLRNNIRFYLFLTNEKREYITEQSKFDKRKTAVQTMGIDLNLFKPLSQEKCREAFNLPIDKFLVLYIGRFDSLKGLPIIIDIVRKLQKRYNIGLVAVGGSSNDPLYPLVRRATPYVFGRIANKIMPLIYGAGDALAYFFKDARWSGPTVAAMEAMACNRYVISNTLFHVQNQIKNMDDYGCFTGTKESIQSILEHLYVARPKCRSRLIAEKLFGWDVVIENMKNIYKLII